MWVRKSEQEIAELLELEEKKRNSLLRPFLFALIPTVIAVAAYSVGIRGGWLRGGVIFVSSRTGVSWQLLVASLFLFAFFFGIAFLNNRRVRSPDHLLCSVCKEPSHANSSTQCSCGGALEPFAFYTWTEEDTNLLPKAQ